MSEAEQAVGGSNREESGNDAEEWATGGRSVNVHELSDGVSALGAMEVI